MSLFAATASSDAEWQTAPCRVHTRGSEATARSEGMQATTVRPGVALMGAQSCDRARFAAEDWMLDASVDRHSAA